MSVEVKDSETDLEKSIRQASRWLYDWCYNFAKDKPQGEELISRRHARGQFWDSLDSSVREYLETETREYSTRTGSYLTNGQRIRNQAEIDVGLKPPY